MPKCRICQSEYRPFMSFGKMPIANGFLREDEFENEYFFELAVAFCENCKMVQLVEQPAREKMFNENYPFFSSTSKEMAIHFKEFADHVINKYCISKDPFVIEIGSNDGILLQHFASKNIRHLGIEPSANVAEIAIKKGINSVCNFFDEELANEIARKYGLVDIFLGANVMCHIPNLHSVINGIDILLKKSGFVIFEDPYLCDVIKKTSYDQFYDEHVFLFSVSSISYLFERHNMEVIDLEPQWTHGGSMRYIIARKGMAKIYKNVLRFIKKEKALGIHKLGVYDKFRKNCEKSRDLLVALLYEKKKQDKNIVGYAATSKSTTILNYCGISTELIDYISDTTPIKQGKFSPGTHIPIRPYEEFLLNYPDYAVLFAYNHAKEIMSKEKKFLESGGKWIVYVPKVNILE